MLASDYFAFHKGNTPVAQSACSEIERAAKRYVTMDGTEYFTVQSQNSAWETVASCFQSAGLPDKAAKIRHELEKRSKSATKRAV